jgi:hypothetical protein
MRKQRTIGLRAACVLLLGSCGQVENDAADTITAKLPPATAIAQAPEEAKVIAEPLLNEVRPESSEASLKPVELRQAGRSRYTSLEAASCKPLAERTGDAGSRRWRCDGTAGYALETSATGRQQFAIIGPDGSRTQLDLSGISTNGTLGKLAEWRGEATGQPRALIVRVNAEAEAKNSSLVVAKLDASPCIVAVIARGPAQNEKARSVADGKQLKCSAP